jgi:hypothetical protein
MQSQIQLLRYFTVEGSILMLPFRFNNQLETISVKVFKRLPAAIYYWCFKPVTLIRFWFTKKSGNLVRQAYVAM